MLLLFPLLACASAIPEGYRRIAGQYQVPAEILYAIALTESATRVGLAVRPWPWTLNVRGKGYRYRRQHDACLALQNFSRHVDPKHIDIGLGQINLGWHAKQFSSPCAALSPYLNLAVAAELLRQRYDEQPGSWLNAAGRYHHPAGGIRMHQYQRVIQHHLQTLNGGTR
ncbi:transglycosylase SLT domain-containing protein [Winslowiella toletana]|nr:transglycosylase SLT domain-containing protein [Winslowiella toletana]